MTEGLPQWFLDGLGEGKLLLHRCERCGACSEPRSLACPVCGSGSLAPVAAAGAANLISWTRTHSRPPAEGGPAPSRVFVIAELEEGPWWWGELLGAGDGEPAIGEPLALDFPAGADGQPLPAFRAA